MRKTSNRSLCFAMAILVAITQPSTVVPTRCVPACLSRQRQLALLAGLAIAYDQLLDPLGAKLFVGVEQFDAIDTAVGGDIHIEFVGDAMVVTFAVFRRNRMYAMLNCES